VEQQIVQTQGSISGPRWAGLYEFLLECALACNVKYRTLERQKGLLQETIYFEVEGTTSNLRAFNVAVNRSIEQHNA